MRVIGTDDEYIAKYIFRRDDGAQFELDNSDVIHFRYALNPWNARRGASPIQSGLRQIAGDNSAATFHGALLRNCAVMSLLVSVKDGQNDNTTPDQLDEFTRLLSQKLRGDNAGAIAGVNLPLDVHKMGYSPDEMALDKLIAYYETRICALLRVDPMVVSLGSGTMQKTYANMGEALNDFWERRIMPTKKRHSAVLGAQLLPLFGLDPSVYRISWDYRNVAPLQENEDARHVRYREDYRAKVIDLYDAQIGLGMNPAQSMRGVFYGDEPAGEGDATKSLKIRDRNGAWHDRLGLFASEGGGSGLAGAGAEGAGGSREFEDMHTWVGDDVPEESQAFQAGKAAAAKKLSPFTNPDRDAEAGVAVVEEDGSWHRNDITIGKSGRVDVPAPRNKTYALFHTHDDEETYSFEDWEVFLNRPMCRQSHVLAPGLTYSVHKPAGWIGGGYSYEQVMTDVLNATWTASEEIINQKENRDVQTIASLTIKKLAKKYGILYRVGTREPS